MLRQYGPNVPEHILQKLVAAFGELRNLADQGIINYPYSTREVVNIVKHLQVWHLPVCKSLKEVINLGFFRFLFVCFLPNLYQVFPFLFITDSYWSNVTQLCPTLWDPMDCRPPGSSVHGIFQARILEWVAISFSRRSSWPRDWTWVSPIVGRHFTIWETRKDWYIPGVSIFL